MQQMRVVAVFTATCALLAEPVASAAGKEKPKFLRLIGTRSLSASGVPDEGCRTGVLSLKEVGKPQACCAGFCGMCDDHPSCKSVRGQNSESSCCAAKVVAMECGMGAPASDCYKKCEETVPPCIMANGEVFTTPDPSTRHAGTDANKVVANWKLKVSAVIRAHEAAQSGSGQKWSTKTWTVGKRPNASSAAVYSEGYNPKGHSDRAVSDGYNPKAHSDRAISEGYNPKAQSDRAISEGYNPESHSERGLSEGYNPKGHSDRAISEGYNPKAGSDRAISEGYNPKGHSDRAISEGYNPKAGSDRAISEGYNPKAHSERAISEGYTPQAVADRAISEGYNPKAHSERAISEGYTPPAHRANASQKL